MERRAAGKRIWRIGVALLAALPAACDNCPYPESQENDNTLYSTFYSEPAHMDPAQSYSAGDYSIIGNVLEPPFQYHYLKRPYELIPLTAREVPKPERRQVTFGGETIDAVVYTIRIQPKLLYQDHPCFVEANRRLTEDDLRGVRDVWDIKPVKTREVTAADFVHAIRRLADPRLACPLYPTFAKNLLGLAEYHQMLQERLDKARAARQAAAGPLYNREQDEKYNPVRLDYADGADKFPFARVIDRHTFEIVLQHPYPQMLYWMALPFFAPVPPEAIEFYNQRPLLERSIIFDKSLVGTGPFLLREFDPTNQIVLERNRRFRPERYPDLPRPPDDDAEALAHYEAMKAAGMLADVGKRLPMLDRIVYRMERESIPRWNKFLQGYYDDSGIQSDLFDQAVKLSSRGTSELTEGLEKLGIRLLTSEGAGFYFYAFNMKDPVIGGHGEKQRKLRHAISIAFDTEERIAIFDNGRGVASHGPIPPGIFGYEMTPEGINPIVYRWDAERERPVRRSLEEAKKLLAEAGYPNGYGPDGQLSIRFITSWASAEGRSRVRFVRKQFQKLNIHLDVETSDGNRFLQKVLSGSFQFCRWGWQADYPDPENFLFLFYAPDPNTLEGQTIPKYYSPTFNALFRKMKAMENTPERLAVIREALAVLRSDAPAIFVSHPVTYDLCHDWCRNVWPNAMALNERKFHRIDVARRTEYRRKHNKPRWLPVVLFLGAFVLTAIPAVRVAARRLRQT